MNLQRIKKLFRKYDVDFQGRRQLSPQLENLKPIRKSFRDSIFSQGNKTSKICCLLSGAVEIFYTISCEIKEKFVQDDEEKELLHKNLKIEQRKITISSLQSELEIINEEALLQYIEKQEKRNIRKILQKNEDQSKPDQNKQTRQEPLEKKEQQTVFVKSKYSVVVTSSECEYIQLSFGQAEILLKERIQLIRQKDVERQKVIKQRIKYFEIEIQQNQKKRRIEKLSIPNLYSRNTKSSFEMKNIQSSPKSISHKTILDLDRNQFNRDQNRMARSQGDQKIKNSNSPLLNNFSRQIQLFDQNQVILERYRSKKAFQKLHIASYPQNQPQTFIPIFESQKLKIHGDDKLFKENLKKIIQRKLNFEKKHGEGIKELASASKELPIIISEARKIIHTTRFPKSHSQTKLESISQRNKVKNSKPKINTFFLHQEQNEISSKKGEYQDLHSERNNSSTKASPSRLSLNFQLQQPIRELIQIQRMRKKFQQDALFLKLQNLDSYFEKFK